MTIAKGETPTASVMLAAPCYGGMVNMAFADSLLKLQRACAARGLPLEIVLSGGDALVTRARSRLATAFLASAHTHLLFVDADIGFDPESVFRMLAFDKPLVGGVYPLKKIYWDKVTDAVRRGAQDLQAAALGYVVRFLPNPEQSVELVDGFGQVAYVPTGFMLIARGVFEKIGAAHPELSCVIADLNSPTERATMFFETMIDPVSGEHLSEDYAFCRRWQALGGEIWADFQTRLTHVGHAAYTGSLIDALA